jgi:hypothetical protein
MYSLEKRKKENNFRNRMINLMRSSHMREYWTWLWKRGGEGEVISGV